MTAGTAAEVALAAPTGDWSVSTPLQQLTEGIEYSLYGGTSNNEWSSAHVAFTTASLAALSPGRVLRQRYDERRDDFVDAVTSIDDFRVHACDGYRN